MDRVQSVPRVAIFGAGPSAAYINAACQVRNIIPDVYTVKKLGSPGGAFWLRLSPRITLKTEKIHMFSVGNSQTYLSKQWGEQYANRNSSFPHNHVIEFGYNPIHIWDSLWEGANIVYTSEITDEIASEKASDYDIVFMTFPTDESKQDYRELVVKSPIVFFPSPWHLDNTVIYNGEPGLIVRVSMLFKTTYVEYTNKYIPDMSLYNQGKVVFFNDIHPDAEPWDPQNTPADNIVLVGRYAEWDRKVLSHEAYSKALVTLDLYQSTGRIIKNARRSSEEPSLIQQSDTVTGQK